MDDLRSDVDAVKTLVQQNIVISAMHATITLRRAAQEQRQGLSMAFDEICATEMAAPAIECSLPQVLAGPQIGRAHV